MAQERSSTRVMAKLLERQNLHRFEDDDYNFYANQWTRTAPQGGRGGETAQLYKGTFSLCQLRGEMNSWTTTTRQERTHY